MTRSAFMHRRGSGIGDLLSADSFNRADGSIGSTNGAGLLDPVAWTTQNGTWNILGNQARASAVSAPRAIATLDLLAADVDLTITKAAADVNGQSLIFRFTDTLNYLLMLGDNTQCSLNKREAGSTSTLIASFGVLNNGTVLRVLAYGTTIRVFLDGVEKGTATSAFNQTATLHGLGAQGTGQRFDDWKAYAS